MTGERERQSNLPARRPSLIGREEEVRAIRQRLLHAEAGLMMLTGAGGCGKTSLALQVARDLLGEFPGGVWLVELAPLSDAALVPQALASVLGIREGTGRTILDALVAYLEPRAALLVVDNCEHLVDACAHLVETLLSACPRLRVLATSREPLRIAGEVTWRVPSLEAPDPRRALPPQEVAGYAAVRLFVERAQAAKSSFALTTGNSAAVSQIAGRLDGMPLAIELAAARIGVLAVEQILARLDDSFRLLAGGSRTAPSRQQTLRATLDWSHDLLDEPERALFRRLALFAGGWDLEAAEAVCAGGGTEAADVLDLLGNLVDKSLVLEEEQGGQARYRLLEPVRQYAQGRLAASDDREAVGRRHAEHFLALAEEAEPRVRGPDQVAWLERLEREHDNLRAALGWSLAVPGDPGRADVGLRLAAALAWFWWLRRHFREARAWLERALGQGGTTAARARALVWAGLMARWSGEYARAAALYEESLVLSRQVGDPHTVAWAQILLGDVADSQGDSERAVAVQEAALAQCRDLGDPWLTAFSLEVLGEALRVRGDDGLAAARYEESLALCRAIGERRGIATALCDLGYVALRRGDSRRAAALLEESLRLASEIREERRMAMCLEGLAGVAVATGRPERAARLLGPARAWRDLVGVPMELADRAPNALSLDAARAALEPAAFEAAWEEGRRLSLEEAVTLVLSGAESGQPSGAPLGRPIAAGPAAPLTPRETEVAALVARGLTNRQIAERLVISEATARTHVDRILTKLDLHSRAQIAAWAAERGLRAPAAT